MKVIETILTLDPSSAQTGYSILTNDKLITYGIIKKTKDNNLLNIYNNLKIIIETYNPEKIIAEQMFVGSNRKTALTLGQIHGIINLISQQYDIPLIYYSVMTIKSKTLNGIKKTNDDGTKKTGKQMKLEVQKRVNEIYKTNITNCDISDAISVGICYFRGGN